jgi:hypothetical protein
MTRSNTLPNTTLAFAERLGRSSSIGVPASRRFDAVAISLLLAAALAACGGGSVATKSTAAPAPVPAPAPIAPAPIQESTLAGTVVVVPTPVTVTVQVIDPTQASQTVTLTTATDSGGNFSISAPTAVIPKNSQVAAVVTADGYLPTIIIYSTNASGDLTAVSATNALGTQPVTGPVTLAAMATGVFVFAGLDVLHRLGDGNASGLVNSKLQLPAPPNDQPVITVESQRIPYAGTKTQLQVNLLMRGLQAVECPAPKAILHSFDASKAELLPAQSRDLASSPENGDFSTQALSFTLDPNALLGGAIQLDILTGWCEVNNYDDIELVGTTGTLN